VRTRRRDGGERRRDGETGAGVHRLLRGFHQDDGVRPVDSTAGFRGGDDGARRLTVSGGGGASPASRSRRVKARERLQVTSAAPLPSDGGGGSSGQRRRLGKGRRRH
jgi:hypothetical protein